MSKRHNESSLQQRCVSYFRKLWPEYDILFFSVPNGGLRGKSEAQIMVGEGVVRGVSDTILLVPSKGYHGLCIEFKQITYTYDEKGNEHEKRSSQSKDQKAWQKAVESQGYRYAVVWSREEFDALIDDYLGKRY